MELLSSQVCCSFVMEILREINPEYSLEGLMLKLKLQYFGQLTHWKSPWCWERLRAEGKEDVKGWDGWMASLMQWTWTWANSRRWWGTGRPGVLHSLGLQRVKHELGDWTTTIVEKSHSSSICLVPQIGRSMTGGIPHSQGKLEIPSSLYHSYPL